MSEPFLTNPTSTPPAQTPLEPSVSPQPSNTTKRDSREGVRSVIKTILLLLAAPLVALFITSFIFHSYEVYGPSMESTLQNGDRLIVLKAPRTWSKIRGEHFMPKRGQIVVFTRPDSLAGFEGENKQLIKRVIALPGERVVVKDGVITVYSNERPGGFQPDKEADYGSVIGTTDGNGEFNVGPNQVFVCGDNRAVSLDSRTFGPINTDSIVGTAEYRLFPLGKMRGF